MNDKNIIDVYNNYVDLWNTREADKGCPLDPRQFAVQHIMNLNNNNRIFLYNGKKYCINTRTPEFETHSYRRTKVSADSKVVYYS